MNASEHYIFVYGTLRKDAINSMYELLAPEAEYISLATLQAKLYAIAHYPAIIDSDKQTDQVTGELYKARDIETLLHKLDSYERCTLEYPEPHEYRRELRKAKDNAGKQFNVWTYIYNVDISEFEQIYSGDFVEYQQTQYQLKG